MFGEYFDVNDYSRAFQEDHLLPEAAAIWSSSAADMRDYPLSAFVRFFRNHGLLKLAGRPPWRTVCGGSRSYVAALRADMDAEIVTNSDVVAVNPSYAGVEVRERDGRVRRYDRVLIAAHADQARAMLPAGDARRSLLADIPYTTNHAVLHTDTALMPTRRETWASWNYVGDRGAGAGCTVTYWMSRLQSLETSKPLFVTLNAARQPAPDKVLWQGEYEHPSFSLQALDAQRSLWPTQGEGGVWLAGAWCGAGFHEDGLQAGLAAAEQMGGVRRPWRVEDESGRIYLSAPAPERALA